MEKLKYKLWICLFIALTTSSCRKYVEVDQYDQRTLKYTDDYQFVINNRSNFESTYILPQVTSDDIATLDVSQQASWNSEYKAAYIWSSNYYGDAQTDIGWTNLYKQIYVCNEVTTGVMSSLNGTEVQKKRIYGEALVHRAFAYLALVNQYGEIYNPSNANSQVGVPLLLKPNLFQKLDRASVKEIYDQIIKDTEEAIPSLPNLGSHNGHPGKVSAYALLSRCYLFMRNFKLSGEYADKALELKNSLNNLETFIGNTSSFPRKLDDPEIILSKTAAGQFQTQLNPKLIDLFDRTSKNGDLRYELFTATSVNGIPGSAYIRPRFTFEGVYTGLGVPELMLNRAEVYAREGNLAKTLELLNKLRENRFRSGYPTLSITNPADLLPAVINERRREFMGTGFRWFDQRRLSLDADFAKPVIRTFDGVDYTLAPGSNLYIYPVAQAVLELNPEIKQSPR
ncbi:RagB/SusD family nutrient uptake outer membrane protein [Pedobacter sp. MC2016-24]|uniref:RagB/SusD family nutrient uptake outer membrane protein n=1 Tax=Pedobacter sp. MC2016-24 TaxID=2780090 RepID=UPI0018803ECD|nr:RagB/SusD family nutrient uptake outer membrane protein [Pedobacter sp. MC2016-24]MBE9601566.1 RagB/SusD family nutrient uptake outer membrane protein [Pedobacter sp. MC2016-24]